MSLVEENLGREIHKLNGVFFCGWMDVANFQMYVILIMKA
jgi:hypothetical protein